MSDREQILRVLRGVRNRWRLRVALRGLAIVIGAGTVAFLLSAYGLDALRFTPAALTAFRVLAWVIVAGVAAFFLVRPLARRIDDERVALYLEEHEPSLEASILAAVEAERAGAAYSPSLVRGLVRTAVERARAVEWGRRVEQSGLYRSGGIFAAVAVGAVAALMLAPSGVRHGLSALFRPMAGAAEVNPYAIDVTPGDVTIARGSDQLVTAALVGFGSTGPDLFLREREGAPFRRISMLPGESEGRFELLLLNLEEGTDYFVEAEGIRSPVHRIGVADLPYVDRLDQALDFPAYTGLPDRVIEDGGDVAALRGTRVFLTIHPTIPTAGGQLVVEGADAIDLVARPDGALGGEFTVGEDGFYRIQLTAPNGGSVEASPRYTIDALEDQPPEVRVSEPGRDSDASPLDEVYLESEAFDDYGIAELMIVYSVNGGPQDTARLFEGSSPPLREVSAGHTLYLEELELEPGDLITYHALGRDTDRSGRGPVSSDLYFLKIRPFGAEFRQGDAPPGGGGGGGMAGAETSLSELQKQVVAATFNLVRDRARYAPADYAENLVSVRLAQERVRQQVETLTERMGNRGLSDAEDQFRSIAEMLPQAIEEMKAAEAELDRDAAGEALPPEQRALQHLQKAEETYLRYVTMQQQSGGGGGGGAPNADDLADLFELELDKLRNQYETVQRGERREANNEVDEALERLKELARRQQQAAERRRLEAQGGSRGGEEQRGLAQETEELARELQRLSRDSRDADLADAARALQDVAEQMRQSAAQGGGAGAAGAAAAADRLEQAQRRLQREREQRRKEDVDDALERARQLWDRESEVREGLRQIPETPAGQRGEAIRRLQEQKDRMREEVADLERQLDRMAADAAREGDREAARELSEAAEAIRERKIKEKLAYSKGVVEQRAEDEYATRFEADIAMDLAELARRVEEASDALGETDPDPMETALDRTRELVRGAETLDRRLRQDASPRPGEGEQAGQGQPGQGEEQREGRAGEPAEGAQGGGRPGAPGVGGGATRGDMRPLTPEEIRSFRGEFRQRLEDARELGRQLERAGASAEELSGVMEALDALTGTRPYGDLPELNRLQSELRENLQRLEFRLRREVEGDGAERAVLGGSDEVPEGFRSLVEEYFRALSRSGGGG